MQQVRFTGVDSSQQKRGVTKPVMSLTAVFLAVMMVGALLATPSYNSLLVSTGELASKTRELVDGSAVTSQEQALREQLAAVGEGLTLDSASSTIDARFMLAGPAFTQGDTPFSIATSSYQGAPVEAVAPVADGDRILYERGDVTEWWQMAGSSYQQGWTVAAPPADGSTDLSLLVGFGNAAPIAESDTTVRLTLADGSSAWYRDLVAFDANGTDLPATMTVDGSNVRIDVDAAGAVYPVTIDPIITNSEKVLPPATATGDLFGEAIATDGNRMAVSAREADNPAGNSFGRVDVFEWNAGGGTWDLLDSVDYPGAGSADFGWSLDINGDFLVVGAPLDDTNGANAGAAFIFEFSGGSYGLTDTLYECDPSGGSCDGTAAGGFDGANFGYDVAIASNKTTVVGAPDTTLNTGEAYIFAPTGVGGALEVDEEGVFTQFASPAPTDEDRLGESVDITDDAAAVVAGAPGFDSDVGQVYFADEQSPGVYDHLASNISPLNLGGEEFGASVAIGRASVGNDLIAVIGLPFRSRRQPTDTGVGRIQVFNATDGAVVGLGNIVALAADDGFGYDVAFENDTVMTGGPFNNPGGVVYAYAYDPVGDTILNGGAPLANASDTFNQPGDLYGSAVAVADTPNFLIGGSPGHDETQNGRVAESAGRVGVYTPDNPTTYVVGAELTAATSNRTGYSVAIDGNRMALGAISDEATLGDSGAVLTYERADENSSWVFDEVLTYPPSATETAGLYGAALDMEGDYLAVGSPSASGRVDVYEHNGTDWILRDSVVGDLTDNTNGTLDFGYDVAITGDGETLVVGIPGWEGNGFIEPGAVEVYDWGGTTYDLFDTLSYTATNIFYGTSVDVDVVPGTSRVRVVVGYFTIGDIDLWTYEPGDLSMVDEGTINTQYDIGETVALDGNRVVGASATSAFGSGDAVVVIDIEPNPAGGAFLDAVQNPILTGADVLTPPGPNGANQFVDVAGDYVVVGHDDGAGGEVKVFYNDPVYGWGFPNDIGGFGGPLWDDGPLDQIQPSSRGVTDDIGRAVAIDKEVATYTVLAGAPEDDDAGDTAGAGYSTTFTEPASVPIANKITIEDLGDFGDDRLGRSVSVDGDWAVVGEPGQDGGINQGRAHVLQNVAGNWSIVQTLTRSAVAPTTSDRFGWDVALDGDRLVVASRNDGALTYFERADELSPFAEADFVQPAGTVDAVAILDDIVGVTSMATGIVYFYRVGTGSLVSTWNAVSPDPQPADQYGFSLAIGGVSEADGGCAFAAVGAPKHDGAGGDFGQVYLYDNICLDVLTASSQTLEGGLSGTDFGSALAADGLRLVVGHAGAIARIFGGPSTAAVGTAYVYDYNPVTPALTLDQTLESVDFPDHVDSADGYGNSVAIDGDIIVIGSTSAGERDTPWRAGAAYSWTFDGIEWTEVDTFRAADDDRDDAFGVVGVSGTAVLIGARDDDNARGRNSGAVYSYTATAPVSAVANKIITPDTSEEFGRQIAISGTTAVVAEPRGDRVHILEQTAGVWSITQTFNEPNVVDVDIDDVAGRMVVVKDDRDVVYYERTPAPTGPYASVGGTTLGVGGTPSTVLLNGNDVFVGRQNSVTGPLVRLGWLDATLGQEFAPGGIVAGEETGRSLAIDGNLLFVGAPRWDNLPDDEAGRVYIFNTDTNQFTGTIEANGGGILFGLGLAAQNGRLVVGYPGGDGFEAGSPARTGVVETYTGLTTTGATFEQQLSSDDQVISDFFGSKVDIDGDVIVVGANAKALPVVSRAGQVYVYTFDGGTWTESETFTASDGATDDQLGNDVVIEGTSVLAGAWKDDNLRGVDAGAVYSFVVTTAPDNPTLFFDLGLFPGDPTSVAVAPTGIAVSDFDAEVLDDASDDGTSIAAASLGETDVVDSPLSGIELGSTPLSGILLDETSALSSIPVIEVDIEGGWPALFESTGSALADVPLVDVTLGDVAEDAQASGELFSTPLSGIEVEGTPLSGIPLSGILLGDLPLSGISTDVPWCTILAPFLGGTCDPNTTTLLDATLSGIPLSGIPLSGIPLSGIDLAGTPLSGIQVGELELQNSPLSGIPLSGIDVGNTPLSGIPLSGIGPEGLPLSGIEIDGTPLSGIGVDGTPLSGIPLSGIAVDDSPLSGIPLSGIELRNVPLSGIPLSGIDVGSLPLADLPLSGIALADVPLSGIPLSGIGTDWCTLLSEFASEYDCSFRSPLESETDFLNNTTIAELGLRGVPIGELPLSGIPLSGITIGTLPLSGIDLEGIPLSGIPLSGIPLSGIDPAGTPLSGIPLSGITLDTLPLSGIDVQGSPLSGIPLSGIDLANLPLSGIDLEASPLSGIPLSGIPVIGTPLSGILVGGTPLSGIPLSGIDVVGSPLSGIPLSGIDVAGSPLSGIGVDCSLVDCEIDTLGDAIIAGAIDPTTITLSQIQPWLGGLRLGDIADSLNDSTREDLENALAASGLLVGDLTDLDDLTLGDLPASLLSNVLLGDLNDSLWSVTYEDLVGAIIDPLTGEPFANSTLVADVFETYLSGFTFGDFDYFGNATFGDLLNSANTGDFTFADLGPILGLLHLTDLVDLTDFAAQSGTLGTVTEEQLGDLTLLDLFGENFASFDTWTVADLLAQADLVGALYGYEIADLFLMLVGLDPAAFDGLDFTEVETGNLPDTLIDAVTFVAEFEVRDTSNNKTVEVSAQLPGTASYVPGSTIIDDENLNVFTSEPTIDGNTLTWTVNGAIPDSIVFIQFDVKPTVTIGSTSIAATANIQGTDAGGFATAAVAVTEGTEPNDFPATTPAAEDTVYLTYISSETDNDVFSITIGENDELAIQLSSLSVDLDIALYGDPANDAVASALTDESDESPLEPITDPDQTGADTEPLDDFRRLDEEDPNLQFIDLSNSPGTETELLVTDALPAGTYYIQVFGANGATNVEPAALQIAVVDADDRPVCSANGQITDGTIGTFPALTGSTANTLILVNEQRMTSLYSPAEWSDLDAELDEFVAYLNANPQLGIEPIVVSVDGDGTIRAAYDAWDEDANCSPESANAVVQTIIQQAIDPLRDTLEHVMVIGGDQIIPMARLLDVTEIANEYDYRYEFIGDNALGAAGNINALSASFWDRQYLSDEPYGESSARSLGNRFLYVSDIALGRMVETPAEIEAALQHFQDFNGALEANTAAVLGYDFLVDSSEEIAADLAAAGLTVDDDLADGFDGLDKWDKGDAEDKVIPPGGAPDLISLNAHFDHYRALPADGDKVPNFTNNFLANTVANAVPGLLEGSIVFSMGCHGGLSVSDLQILDGTDNNNGDWAQTFAADQAIFIGNTGFGYGDTEAVAYTEKLMALFAEKAVRPTQALGQMGTTTIGQALTFAKNEYASDLSVFSVYDEKALMESTFYGIPFYRVGVTPVPADPVPTNTTTPDSTGNESISLTATPSNTLDATPLGDIYSNPDENGDPQTIVAPGMPIQPSQSFDVSVVDPADSTRLGSVARGALVLDMDSTYEDPTDPVVSTAIFNESVNLPEPALGEVVFPAKPVTINTVTTPGGERQTLVVATGQFSSNDDVFGSQRLDENIDVVVYYADAADTDYTAPTIGAVESTLESTPAGAELTVTLSSTDTDGAVTRVYLLVAANPGVGPVDWVGLDLVKDAASDDWSGSVLLPVGTSDAEFLVQAVDSSGNVGFATNKARNFNEDDTPEPEPPTPGLEVTVDPTNLDAPSGWYTGDVDITVDSSGLPATYEISARWRADNHGSSWWCLHRQR